MIRKEKRKGFSLVELLIAVIILGILTAIIVSVAASSQRKAREATCVAAFDDYQNAFSQAMMSKPGLMKDRVESNAKGYSPKESLGRLVHVMNSLIEEDRHFEWNDEYNAYISRCNDPWGGHYMLTDYPLEGEEALRAVLNNDTSFDSTTYRMYKSKNEFKSTMSISIWATGPDEGILHSDSDWGGAVVGDITNRSYGILIYSQNGTIMFSRQGFENADVDPYLYTGYYLLRK